MQSHLNTPTEHSVLASSEPHTRGASIVAKAMVKKYGEFHALGPIDLDIKPGEFVSMIGPSGCGKSTTLLLASGLEPLTSGSIQIDGKALVKPISEVGIVFQDHLLLDFRTAMQNVMLQQEIRGLDKAKLQARANLLFERLGIKGAENRYPRQLSGGMRQRVSIARALVHDPSMLLMDEPFGALDAITRTQIRHDLEVLWMETQKTVLFITHSIEEAVGLSDRVLVMSKSPGQIVEEIKIDLPRPRPAHLGEYPEFAKYAERIYQIFSSLGVYKF
ncbi:ABC transporter ATP-binding protein [Agrobacterium tumefaciens]|uniref:ABC transporter ATP-binding protein n=2 Tax=Agrobacterium tumefaciens TaxID=358 RepID=A0AA44F499_AGRTU|nr:ABC transporter ATP-binding protein [Agrobacterium tumefaciens]NSL21283.1 ABC transporter ATP-binding protein [Agrobacterium tumefaciens]NTB83855.1 ABC transporter ATP-binding protein [Agrobacterium tumefaciens]NTC20676.1 ABC transporter ATP-binding protein [Agrobacterium tumefaciens]NTC29326.1 ABC transporter ATP-binding protein [Agrobacterium tumefaciens]NTC57822.1 ABC transporter ATP-binding protein [Agrobacterium tumefaciens]